MICVSIGRGRVQQMIAEHRLLVEQGAQLVELRIDYLDRHPDVGQIVRDRPGPAIITIRREKDGGRFRGSEDERLRLLRMAIVAGVEYVDLEDDVAATIPRHGPTKRIISLHDFRRTPMDLDAIHARLATLDADIVKIATLAQTPHDNLRMLHLIEKHSPTISTAGLCMGDIGAPSRILSGRFGAPFSYATFSSERQLAPGQFSFRDMNDIYRYPKIGRSTEVYGVIGDPIQHTLSPLIHNAAFAHLGLDKVYVPFRVPRPNLLEFLADAPAMGVRGLSVTIPHKEGVLSALSDVDPDVEGAGAANTLIFEDGRIRGYNTDLSAALESLEDALRLPRETKNPVEGKTVLVLGAGGAAKAIAFGLVKRGAEVVVTSRTPEKTAALVQRLKCRSVDWSLRSNVKCTVIVNCTPMGMHPNVNESPLERHQLKPAMTVFDTVYNPENTLLLKHARLQGCKVVTGIEMFVRQAALQFRLFTGQEPPEDLMRDVLRRAIAPVKPGESKPEGQPESET